MSKVLTIVLLLMVLGCGKEQQDPSASAGPDEKAVETENAVKQWIRGWQETSQLSGPRAGTATVVHNGFMYVIGGVDGRNFVSTVEYARIQQDGSLGAWQFAPVLNEERGFIDAVVYDGSIYVVGGGNGANGKNLLRSAERAKINADGSLQPWVVEKNAMKIPRRCSKVLVLGRHIYSLGGFGGALLDSVERAQILEDGSLGEWIVEEQTMTLPRYVNAVKKSAGNAYVIGGHDQMKGVGIVDVEWATPQASGELNGWKKTASLQVGRYGLSSASHGKYVYALGGLTGLEYLASVEFAQVQDSGTLASWQYGTELTEPRATFSVVVYKDWIYVVGGTNQDRYLSSVEYATFNNNGVIGFFGTQQQAEAYKQKVASLKMKKSDLPNEGVVQHIQHASMYTYLNVNSNLGNIWLAGPKIDIQKNERVKFSKGVSMSNFYSKELQQQFPVILFVSKIEKVQ